MSKIIRYTPAVKNVMFSADDGEYVKYSDIKHLKARNKLLTKALVEMAEEYQMCYSKCKAYNLLRFEKWYK
jgi:hypothetical protein